MAAKKKPETVKVVESRAWEWSLGVWTAQYNANDADDIKLSDAAGNELDVHPNNLADLVTMLAAVEGSLTKGDPG